MPVFFLCAQESKAVLIQAKHTRTASSHLGARVDSALRQLTEQEMLTDAANSQIPPEVANKDTFRLAFVICNIPRATSKTEKKKKKKTLSPSLPVFCVAVFQSGVSLTGIKEKMEAAKLELKAYSRTLTELISKIGRSTADAGIFHRRHFFSLPYPCKSCIFITP